MGPGSQTSPANSARSRAFELEMVLDENTVVEDRHRCRFGDLIAITLRRMEDDVVALPLLGWPADVDQGRGLAIDRAG